MDSTRFQKGMIPWNKAKDVFIACICGSVVRLEPNQVGRKKFCSKACFYEGRVLKGLFVHGHPDMVPAEKRGHTEATRQKMSESHRGKRRGELNPNWQGGLRSERKQAMGRFEYQDWRKAVFRRDDYTCQACDKRGGYLEADHIKPWASYIELRYEISNGRTLCLSCHRATETWGGRALKAA